MSSSSNLILLLSTFSTILFNFYVLFMLMSNWYMINTFVLNLGTATVFILLFVNECTVLNLLNLFI